MSGEESIAELGKRLDPASGRVKAGDIVDGQRPSNLGVEEYRGRN
jgi:hypothetical protein